MPGTHWLAGSRIANAHAAITPSNTTNSTTELPSTTVAIYVGVAGDVVAQLRADTTQLTYKNAAAGEYLEGNFKFILSTGTSASSLVALYVI